MLIAGASFSAVAADEAKTTLDFNLRYENVDQDAKDANALTLRTRINYTSASYNGFTGVVEFEDSRVIAGVDDYKFGPTDSGNTTDSIIADPETTELDQAYVQYKSGKFTTKIGRQVITLDGHRHVGHVGWRQDRQTFDAATFKYVDGKLAAQYSYLTKRNRIFGEDLDIDSKDHLLNVSYKTDIGKVAGYFYSLEADTAGSESMDTFGISLTGKKDGFLYAAEFASQSFGDADADYIKLEGGYNFGVVTAKLGYEVLGSDDGGYGFSTPLATLHKFNGWADTFLNTPPSGLEDVYVSLSGKVAGGKVVVAYHDFSADEGSADLGDEIDLLYAKKFGKNYSAGVKYAMYSKGDAGTDTDKLWVWVGAKF